VPVQELPPEGELTMDRAKLTQVIADALDQYHAKGIESVEVLDPENEHGNEGVLSIMFEGEDEATFVSIEIRES
jgi:hypothetical protein